MLLQVYFFQVATYEIHLKIANHFREFFERQRPGNWSEWSSFFNIAINARVNQGSMFHPLYEWLIERTDLKHTFIYR